jgi:hypothetical protein
MKDDKAYEIVITPIISHDSNGRVRKVEAIQTKTLTFFRYVYAAVYHGYDAVIDEKIFMKEDEAIAYWNEAVAKLCIMVSTPQYVTASA